MNSNEIDDRIVAALAPAHTSINAKHGKARAALLASLPDDESFPSRRRKPAIALRYVAGGLGLSATAASIALALWLFSSTSPAAAMERMAKALDQINGYTYRMEKVYISRKGEGRTVRQITLGSWRTSPAAMLATMHIGEIAGTNPNAPGGKVLVHLVESHQAGQGGILIDHLTKTFWRVSDNLDASSIPAGSPQVAVHMMQQRRGRVVKDLGMKMLHGQEARGLEIVLDNAQPVSELGPTSFDTKGGEPAEFDWRNTKFEVWIDPNTDLPIEFRGARSGADFETTYCFNNLDWNVEFADGPFDLVPPADYTELDKSPHAEKQ
jgi:hypothetical protein